jgi:hypothetical protein
MRLGKRTYFGIFFFDWYVNIETRRKEAWKVKQFADKFWQKYGLDVSRHIAVLMQFQFNF